MCHHQTFDITNRALHAFLMLVIERSVVGALEHYFRKFVKRAICQAAGSRRRSKHSISDPFCCSCRTRSCFVLFVTLLTIIEFLTSTHYQPLLALNESDDNKSTEDTNLPVSPVLKVGLQYARR